jgi:hypothetical protein
MEWDGHSEGSPLAESPQGLDPRLNYEQSLEIALFVSQKMSGLGDRQ